MKRELAYTHTIERVARPTLRSTESRRVEKCRVTPKRIYIESGDVFDLKKGTRIAPRADIAWSMYRISVDLATLKPLQVAGTNTTEAAPDDEKKRPNVPTDTAATRANAG